MTLLWAGVLKDEPHSKANSRKLVTINDKPRFIKSAGALAWAGHAILQLGQLRPAAPLAGNLCIKCWVYASNRRRDLDCSLVFDVLQKGHVVKNDRSFREQHLYWFLDAARPRVEIEIHETENVHR